MVPLTSLWLPILLSAVFVFVASAVIHMVMTYHRSDFRAVPGEGEVMSALRPFNLSPGDYMMPRGEGPQSMKDPAFIEKMNRGPVAVFTILPSGPWAMGTQLGQWFIYCVVVSLFAAYVAGRTLPPGTPYIVAFRVTSAVAFASYALALWQNSIWYKRAWMTTLKSNIDALAYALLTGGTFGWLWPR